MKINSSNTGLFENIKQAPIITLISPNLFYVKLTLYKIILII